MSLGDSFPEHIRKEFASRNLEIGQALLLRIDEFEINTLNT